MVLIAQILQSSMPKGFSQNNVIDLIIFFIEVVGHMFVQVRVFIL